jgi:hypothetical protein
MVLGDLRFRSVVDPFFALTAAYAAVGLMDRVHAAWDRSPATVGGEAAGAGSGY